MNTPRFRVFLGGHDLEMVTIRDLVADVLGPDAVCDKGLGWGAKASAYGAEIAEAAKAGLLPVLIELGADIALPAGCIEIDHHGARVGESCALRQVFDLLGLPYSRWSRHFVLVAANDVGHVGAMAAMGASIAEMTAIRAADRAAQGITRDEEASGLAALAAARRWGDAIVVDLPHARGATVTDPLALAAMAHGQAGGQVADEGRLVILSPYSVNIYADGAAIMALDRAFPGGWRGGELPRRGFWGFPQRLDEAALREVLARA